MASRNFTYSYVVARSQNNVIGCENQLPWRLQTDLRRFKKVTSGKPMIMGRKTYDSIGHPLPNRPNIVVTRDPLFCPSGVLVVNSKAEAMRIAEREALKLGTREIMIIGGEAVFEMFTPELSRVYLTQVKANVRGDAFFNTDFETDSAGWTRVERDLVSKSAIDEYDTDYAIWERSLNVQAHGDSFSLIRMYA